MRVKVIVFSLWAILPTVAVAEVDCTALSALSRLNAGMPIFEQAARSNDPASNLGSLQADMQRYDSDNVTFALRDLDNVRDRQALADLAEITQQMSQLAERGDIAALRDLVQAQATENTFRVASWVLSRVACPAPGEGGENATATGSDDSATGSDTGGSGALSGRSLNISQSFVWIATIAFIAALLGLFTWLRLKRKRTLQRRGQRFPINRAVNYNLDGKNLSGRLLDISGLGTKMKHNGELENAIKGKVTLVIAGRPIAGQVMWANTHYAGIRFDRPFARSQLRKFIADRGDSARAA